jgi:DNA-binding protein YbaB
LLAINDAVAVVDKKTEEEMSRFTMGMGFWWSFPMHLIN